MNNQVHPQKNLSIALDVRGASEPFSGVQVCIRQVVHCLGERDDVNLTLLGKIKDSFSSHFGSLRIKPSVGRFDIVSGLDAKLPFWARGRVESVVIHDIAVLTHSGFSSERFRQRYRNRLLNLNQRVKLMFTPSKHVKREVIREFHIPADKIHVLPWGVSSQFHPSPISEVAERLKKYNLYPGYILFVGVVQTRKNVSLLLDIFSELKHVIPDVRLVIVGGIGYQGKENLESRIQSMSDVRWLRDVSQEELPYIYAGANHLLFPSEHEGFGLPTLEAMACGIPVVAANGGALPEVVGKAGLLCDTGSTRYFVEACQSMINNRDQRSAFVSKSLARSQQFTWEKTVDQFVTQLKAIH